MDHTDANALMERMNKKEIQSKALDAFWLEKLAQKAAKLAVVNTAELELTMFLEQEAVKAKDEYGDF